MNFFRRLWNKIWLRWNDDEVQYVIEFRSGMFYQRIEEKYHGGRVQSARRFASISEARDFMDKNPWIAFNGGMVTPCEPEDDGSLLVWTHQTGQGPGKTN